MRGSCMGRRIEIATHAAIAVLLVASAGAGFAYPHHLIGTATWSLAVAAVLYGLGGWVGRLARVELALDERLVLGTCVWTGATGWMLAVGQASRAPLLGIAALGFATTLLGLLRRLGLFRRRWPVRRDPAVPREAAGDRIAWVVLWILLGIFLTLELLGSIGSRGNLADDQAAYTAFVKRVLDRGDLIEPFSLRRLSAYGGQTMLHALAALRGDVASLDLLDHGIFQWFAVLVVVGMARRRGLPLVITAAILAVLLSLWDIQANSGAVWTGFTCFLAAYGFASRDDLAPRVRLALSFLVLGVACTLRQNYLLPAGLFGLLLLAAHLRDAARRGSWRQAWAQERTTALVAIGATAAVVVPYMIAAFLSSGTPLYPIALGTGNPAMPLRPTGGTWLDEIGFFVAVGFTPEPIHVWWLLLPVMALADDRRPMRPHRAFLIAAVVGFGFLVHSFQLSDAWDLWRYAFGYLTALAIAFAIEVGAELPRGSERRAAFGLPAAAVFVVWLALAVNLVETRLATVRRFTATLQNIKAAWVFGSAKPDPRLRSYAQLQRAVPEGATLAVLLDDPWMLDYARNPIVNLDLPGCAAPAPGLPSFTDPAHWRSYFASRAIRYVAFVDPGYSAFLYRRAAWLPRMFKDDELFQFIAARVVDAVDALGALAGSSRVVFHADAMYVIDLGDAAAPEPERGPAEAARMDRFIAQVSERELGHKGWQLARRSTVVFYGDSRGARAGAVAIAPASSFTDPTASALWSVLAGVQGSPHRWLADRTRVRVFGTGRERLHAKIWVQLASAATVPTLAFSIDGRILAEVSPDRDGYVVVDAPAACTGWCDLYIAFNTTFDWSPDDPGFAELLEFDWAAP